MSPEKHIEEDPAPKKIRIERKDLERIGYTPGRIGCYYARMKRSHAPRSEYCRCGLIEDTPEGPDIKKKLQGEMRGCWTVMQRSIKFMARGPLPRNLLLLPPTKLLSLMHMCCFLRSSCR